MASRRSGYLDTIRILQHGPIHQAFKNKYKAQKVKEDGHTFDSKTEYMRYVQLREELAAGLICHLQHHVRYNLHVNGEKLGYYEADFVYKRLSDDGIHWELHDVVEDVKSPYTAKLPMYRWKKKHMKAEYGIEIQEVYPRCPQRKMSRKAAKRANRRAVRRSLISWTTRNV